MSAALIAFDKNYILIIVLKRIIIIISHLARVEVMWFQN